MYKNGTAVAVPVLFLQWVDSLEVLDLGGQSRFKTTNWNFIDSGIQHHK